MLLSSVARLHSVSPRQALLLFLVNWHTRICTKCGMVLKAQMVYQRGVYGYFIGMMGKHGEKERCVCMCVFGCRGL